MMIVVAVVLVIPVYGIITMPNEKSGVASKQSLKKQSKKINQQQTIVIDLKLRQ